MIKSGGKCSYIKFLSLYSDFYHSHTVCALITFIEREQINSHKLLHPREMIKPAFLYFINLPIISEPQQQQRSASCNHSFLILSSNMQPIMSSQSRLISSLSLSLGFNTSSCPSFGFFLVGSLDAVMVPEPRCFSSA